MKILIDMGHPAHVHYFRNFIRLMKNKNHEFLITARDKEVTLQLLDAYKIPYISRGKGEKSVLGKFIYLFIGDFIIYRAAKKFQPDLFISFGAPYAAQVSKLMNKNHIAFSDTEHAELGNISLIPFTDNILVPSCFTKELNSRQIRFDGYMELCYLHPKIFIKNSTIFNHLGISKNEKYIILRFVSWNASHDVSQSGLSLKMKKKLVFELSKYMKVFISSEGELPQELKQFKINISPEKIHDVLAYANLYIGEGATMASECAVLGTPAIYVNSLTAGTLEEQEKYGLIYSFRNSEGVFEKAVELLNIRNHKKEWQRKRQKMLLEKIDVTAFMVWFVENYPKSAEIMKKNPDYQYNFK